VLATLRKRRGEKREFWFDGFEILGCCGSRILPGGVAHFSGGSGLGFCVGFEGKRRAERAFGWVQNREVQNRRRAHEYDSANGRDCRRADMKAVKTRSFTFPKIKRNGRSP
jgi:hypothetical protein